MAAGHGLNAVRVRLKLPGECLEAIGVCLMSIRPVSDALQPDLETARQRLKREGVRLIAVREHLIMARVRLMRVGE